ncbi:MAG TPA: cytochrome c [Gemmatimonadales bacterium]|nr:cytochrome c [Gemmatimonadales bacterium]
MRPASSFVLMVVLAVVRSHPLAAQTTHVDPLKAGRGQHLWESRQCDGCHSFGREQSTGPDLIGVTDRRSPEWLHAWLRNPSAPDDPTARALRKQYNSQMPDMSLTDAQVDDVIAYLAQQSQLHAKR